MNYLVPKTRKQGFALVELLVVIHGLNFGCHTCPRLWKSQRECAAEPMPKNPPSLLETEGFFVGNYLPQVKVPQVLGTSQASMGSSFTRLVAWLDQ